MIQRSQHMASRSKRAMRCGSSAKTGRQDLERNLTPQLGVGGAIDFVHAARAQLLRDAVMRDLFPNQMDGPPSMAFILGRVWSKFNQPGDSRVGKAGWARGKG